MADIEWAECEEEFLTEWKRKRRLREAYLCEHQTDSADALVSYLERNGLAVLDFPESAAFTAKVLSSMFRRNPSLENCRLIVELAPHTPIALEAEARVEHVLEVEEAGKKIHRILSARTHARKQRNLTTT